MFMVQVIGCPTDPNLFQTPFSSKSPPTSATFRLKKKALVSPHELHLTLDLYGEEAQLRIRMLSYPKGAALWEYSIKSESWSELKVSSDFVRNYDMINNDCVNQKCFQEFQFDEIDLSRLKFAD